MRYTARGLAAREVSQRTLVADRCPNRGNAMDQNTNPKRLSKELTPEQVAEETRDVDETLPEAATTIRRPMSADRGRGGAFHQVGEEEEGEETQPPPIPTPLDPPRRPESK